MGDVTDRMAPRGRAGPARENSNLGTGSNDLKALLAEVEPLPGSSLLSQKEVEEIILSTEKMVGEAGIDWTKRLNMLKTFRSLCCDPAHHPQITLHLRHLMPPLQGAVKDLRSQVGREACLTVAFLMVQLGVKADFFIEPMMATLFSLLVANVKIVSLTAASTICLLYEYVPSFRLLPPLQVQMNSKSKEVRRAVCSVLRILLTTWPFSQTQKHASMLGEIIKKGLGDADADARMSAREAFPAFQRNFPGHATVLLDSLEAPQKRQLLSSLASQPPMVKPVPAPRGILVPKVNGAVGNHPPPPPPQNNTGSLSRQGSLIKKTSIPVLASRLSPAKAPTPGQGRSASAIDLQAVNRAKQQHQYSTMRSPLRTMGRTNSAITPTSGTRTMPKYSAPSHQQHQHHQQSPGPIANNTGTSTLDRSRNRSRMSRLSHSQPGSRSNSPSSKYAYATYTSPYAQQSSGGGEPNPLFATPPPRGSRRISSTSSASSSRDTSPQGRIVGHKARSRSISNSPYPNQVLSVLNTNSSTAKMLLQSREAESSWADGMKRREYSEPDYGGGNHSDSEDSMSSHRSFRSETFSPPSSARHFFAEDNVEELLTKCGSAKWSERKEGLHGLQNYLQRHGSIPPQYFNRIGQLFCRIFMDAHTKVLSLFLDVLHAVLYRHAKDLVDFTTILLNRILTKLGSDLLTSVLNKLLKTLEIITEEMPADLQFSAVTHYLCDPTQTPNSRSRVAALTHLYNLSAISVPVKLNELQLLADKLLDWSADMRSHELRRTSQKVFHALFDMATPQMTLVMGKLSIPKQDFAKTILRNHISQDHALVNNQQPASDVCGWSSIKSDIQSLESTQNSSAENDLVMLLSRMTVASPGERSYVIADLFTALKESTDERLLEHHKEILKVLFYALGDGNVNPTDKSICFCSLEELCNRAALSQTLAAFTELFIVRIADVQIDLMPREVSKAAENCGMALALNFPPEVIARAVCTIVNNREVPVCQMGIKMLQRLCDTCHLSKLRTLFPDILSTLISAYDHPDSAVRKAAVFAIVALHSRLGPEELSPHLAVLNGSKLKLLELYIQRAQQSASTSV